MTPVHDGAAGLTTVPHNAFVGRAAELATLQAALAEAGSSSARIVLIGGDAGIGKSRLVAEFLDGITPDSATVLRGGCLDLGRVPYAPFVLALRGLVRAVGAEQVHAVAGRAASVLASLVPALATDDDPPLSARFGSQGLIFEAVLHLLDRLGVDRPCLLVLEDLHWADRSTLDLLAFLAGSLTTERVLVVATYRTTDLSDEHPFRSALPELRRRPLCATMELSGFTAQDFARLLSTFADGPCDSDVVTELLDRSDGNPFFAEELWLHRSAVPASVPPGVRDFMLVRIEALTETSRQVLGAAAVAGRSVRYDVLAAVLGLSPPALDEALRACVARNLLLVNAGEQAMTFRHSLTREAAYERLLPGERARLHGMLAEVLEKHEADSGQPVARAAELAHHWYHAGRRSESLCWSVRAGDEASAVFGFADAAVHYEHALQMWDGLCDAESVAGLTKDTLLMRAADACRWMGRTAEAVDMLEQALAMASSVEDADPERAATLFERLGRFRWEAGDGKGSLTAYERGVDTLNGRPRSAQQAWVLAGYGTALMQVGRHRDAIDWCRRAIEVTESVDAELARGHALNTMGVSLAMTGNLDEGIAALRAASELARSRGGLEGTNRAYANLTYVLEAAGRLEDALCAAREGMACTRELGVELTGSGVLLTNTASVLLQLGRWDEMDRVAADAMGRNLPAAFEHYLHLVLAEAAVCRGRFADAARELAAVDRASHLDEPQFVATACAVHAEVAAWQHHYDQARTSAEAGLAALEHAEETALELKICAIALRAAADVRAQEPRRPRRGHEPDTTWLTFADEMLARVQRLDSTQEIDTSTPEMAATVSLCHIEHARVRREDGHARWSELAARWLSFSRPYPAAYALWRGAQAAADARDPAQAARLLREAGRLIRRLGADELERRVELLAVRLRVRLDDVGRSESVAAPDEFGLTAREQEVMVRVARGYTNRQIARELFISEKTASVHVSNILAKLGVATRGQAAALAHSRGLYTSAGGASTNTKNGRTP